MSLIKFLIAPTKALNLHMVKKFSFYLKFLFQGTNKYNIHSPMVHDFIENILDNSIKYYSFVGIEHVRSLLLKQNEAIELKDLGAGSKYIRSSTSTINILTKKVQSRPEKAQIIFRIASFFQMKNILEIGTSLGLTTAYLSNANKNGKVTTIEGDPKVAKLAQKNFNTLKLKNVELINKSFDEIIPLLLKNQFDLIFFDGNHSKEATLRYFYWLVEHANEDSIFIFDDIYWSNDMKQAWKEICNFDKVMLSLDIFSLGMVFFKKNREKEHIKLVHRSNFY
jgi:predicted O-methyltransferase YrrM